MNAVAIDDVNHVIATFETMLAQAKAVRTQTLLASPGTSGVEWVTLERLEALTGFSTGAARGRIERGEWPHGTMWTKAGNGGRHDRIMVRLEAYNRWVEKGTQAFAHETRRS